MCPRQLPLLPFHYLALGLPVPPPFPVPCRVHQEPLSDVHVWGGGVYSADHLGGIKAWARPQQARVGGSAGSSPGGVSGLSTRVSKGLKLSDLEVP